MAAFGAGCSCAVVLVKWGKGSNVSSPGDVSSRGAWARVFERSSDGVVGRMCSRVLPQAHSNCVDLVKGCVDDRATSSEVGEEDRAVVGSVTVPCVS